MVAPNESLAAYAHDAWSRWMRYLFNQCIEVGDGCLEIPSHLVERWTRQMNTDYKNLPENEKNSDREESELIMKIFIGDDP